MYSYVVRQKKEFEQKQKKTKKKKSNEDKTNHKKDVQRPSTKFWQ